MLIIFKRVTNPFKSRYFRSLSMLVYSCVHAIYSRCNCVCVIRKIAGGRPFECPIVCTCVSRVSHACEFVCLCECCICIKTQETHKGMQPHKRHAHTQRYNTRHNVRSVQVLCEYYNYYCTEPDIREECY